MKTKSDFINEFEGHFQNFLAGDASSLTLLLSIVPEAYKCFGKNTEEKANDELLSGDEIVPTLAFLLSQCQFIKDKNRSIDEIIIEFSEIYLIQQYRPHFPKYQNDKLLTNLLVAIPIALLPRDSETECASIDELYDLSGSKKSKEAIGLMTDLMENTISSDKNTIISDGFEQKIVPESLSDTGKNIFTRIYAKEKILSAILYDEFADDISNQMEVLIINYVNDPFLKSTLDKLVNEFKKSITAPTIAEALNQYEQAVNSMLSDENELVSKHLAKFLSKYVFMQLVAIKLQKLKLDVIGLIDKPEYEDIADKLLLFLKDFNSYTHNHNITEQSRNLAELVQIFEGHFNAIIQSKTVPVENLQVIVDSLKNLSTFPVPVNQILPVDINLKQEYGKYAQMLDIQMELIENIQPKNEVDYLLVNNLRKELRLAFLAPTIKESVENYELKIQNTITKNPLIKECIFEQKVAIAIQKIKLNVAELLNDPNIKSTDVTANLLAFQRDLNAYTAKSLKEQAAGLIQFRHVCDTHYYKIDKKLNDDYKPFFKNLALLISGLGALAAIISFTYRITTGRYGLFDDAKPANTLLDPFDAVMKVNKP